MAIQRREFLKKSAQLLATGAGWSLPATAGVERSAQEFAGYQERRRKELWGLLGDLPWEHKPGPPKLLKTEKHEGYTLERLVLDLNGVEPVAAILLVPDNLQKPAPGLLFIHWHGGMYDLGKEDRKSTRLNSSHTQKSRMPSSA